MFPLRRILNNAKCILPNVRPMSANAGPLVDVSVDDEGIAIVTMQRAPVNSLNLELLQDLSKSLDEVAKNKSRGLILTSASPTVFSAGLDITELYKPDLKRLETFCTTFQDLWLKLFGSNFITAAAINGHAPAAGCLLSLSCEYRVMVNGKFSIGLNETALGIVMTKWFMDTMCHTIPMRQAEIAITTGRLFSVDDALKVGLIDETASDKADSIEKCKQFIMKFNSIPPVTRSMIKQKIREAPMKWLLENRQQDTNDFIEYIKSPKVQQGLDFYIQSLKQKAAK